jgi:hypothetical protein
MASAGEMPCFNQMGLSSHHFMVSANGGPSTLVSAGVMLWFYLLGIICYYVTSTDWFDGTGRRGSACGIFLVFPVGAIAGHNFSRRYLCHGFRMWFQWFYKIVFLL